MRSKRIDKILGLKFARFKRNGKIGNNTKMNIIRKKTGKSPLLLGLNLGLKFVELKALKVKILPLP